MKRIVALTVASLALAAAALSAAPASAQVVQAQTVTACGTPPNTPVVGNTYNVTQDTTGKLCTSATGGGGGGGAVFGPTAVGSANANPPVVIGGTATGATGGNVTVAKVDASGNLSVNNAQVNGVALSTGNGVSGTGVQRVTLASDSTGQVTIAAGSAVMGHVITDTGSTTAVTGTVTVSATNLSTNIAQMNGVATTMGNGVSGTGVQRVTLASDSTGQVALAAGSNLVGNVGVAQGSTTSGQSGPLMQGAVTTAAPTYTTAQTSPLSIDTSGGLRVSIIAGGGTGGTASTYGAAFPATGTAIGVKNGANMVNLTADGSSNLNVNCAVGCAGGTVSNASSAVATSSTNNGAVSYLYGFNGTTWDQLQVDGSKFLKVVVSGSLTANQSVNEAQINGVTPLMGNGVTGTGSQRVTIASDNTAFSVNATLQTQADTTMVGGINVKEINGVTPLMGNGTTGTGSQRVTIASDNSAFSVNATPVATTAPGTTWWSLVSAASTNSTLISTAAAHSVLSFTAINTTGTLAYFRVYDAASAPTCSSATNFLFSIPVPANTSGAGLVINFPVSGGPFTNGFAACVTGGGTSTDNTSAPAGVYFFGLLK